MTQNILNHLVTLYKCRSSSILIGLGICVACVLINKNHRSLKGKIALVTGGRIKIGYHIVLRFLRCGATVIALTRFPKNAAHRFSDEPDSLVVHPSPYIWCRPASPPHRSFLHQPYVKYPPGHTHQQCSTND